MPIHDVALVLAVGVELLPEAPWGRHVKSDEDRLEELVVPVSTEPQPLGDGRHALRCLILGDREPERRRVMSVLFEDPHVHQATSLLAERLPGFVIGMPASHSGHS